MQATTLTLTLIGLDAHPVRVEVDSGRGPAAFHLVGLAEAAVREARVRVRAALLQLGVDMDEHVLTVSLSPGDLRKTGALFDLAIAVGVAAALGKVPPDGLRSVALLGELSLSGEIRPARGVLAALIAAARAGVACAIVPHANAAEASAATGIDVLVAHALDDVLAHLRGERALARAAAPSAAPRAPRFARVDLADVRGQHGARRALEVAAAGGHNLLMMGPPGAGKTMLARRLPALLPEMTQEEALDVTMIHSVAGLLGSGAGLACERPFRAPHHTVSVAGLVGGGAPLRPGEVSLAHHGCLFLDELYEFGRATVEALRQPLEDGVITVARARERAVFPARPLFVAAVNPCPCGYAGTPRCVCAPERVSGYRARLSGPLLDRIDLHVTLPPVELADLAAPGSGGEPSALVRARVEQARAIQWARRRETDGAHLNGALTPAALARVAGLDAPSQQVLRAAGEALGLSARAWGKVVRVARTLADLEGTDAVKAPHVAEAVHYRVLDRGPSPSSAALRARV